MTAIESNSTGTSLGRGSTPSPVPVRVDPHERLTVLVVYGVVFLIGVDFRVSFGLTPALVVGIALLPIWAPALRAYRYAVALVVVAVLSVASGLILSELSSVDHAVSNRGRVEATVLLVSGIVAITVLLWARRRAPLHVVIALYALGALVGSVAQGETSWKYDLAVPTMLLVVSVVDGPRHGRAGGVLAIVALGVVGAATEGRSLFGIALLTALIVTWQAWPVGLRRATHRWVPAVLVGGLGLVLYLLATALLTGGYLGSTLAERSSTQIETTGSLISGGRPEWAATRQLMTIRPEGYGVGVVPSWSDYVAGKSGLATINVDTGGYAKYYLFGGSFRLHSVAADLWVSHGWIGMGLAALIGFVLVRSLSHSLAQRTASTAVTFSVLLALWYLAFGPIYSNWLDVCVAVGFSLLASKATAGDPYTEDPETVA